MSLSSNSRSKGGIIQPGAIVTGLFGGLYASESNKKRRSRETIRGAVLRSHSENHWMVHWFPIGRTSHVCFNKITVEEDASPLTDGHIKALLQDHTKLYIGGPEKLRNYIDNFYSKSQLEEKK